MRVVPRENEAINEVWIADRDRFSYEGVYSADRLQRPLLRAGGELGVERLGDRRSMQRRAGAARARAPRLGVLASRCATLEELYLARAPGARPRHAQHRSSAAAARISATRPPIRRSPRSGCVLPRWMRCSGLLIIGSNLRREAPMLAHRVRKAAAARRRRWRSSIRSASPTSSRCKSYLRCRPRRHGGGAGRGAGGGRGRHRRRRVPAHLAAAVAAARVSEAHRAAAQALLAGERRAVWLGALAARHAQFADLRALAAATGAARRGDARAHRRGRQCRRRLSRRRRAASRGGRQRR